MAVATYASVIGLGVLYTFISWMFVAGWGMDERVAPASSASSRARYGSAFYPLTDRYFGELLTWAFELLIVTGSFACQLAFFNTSNRYFFSMGREGILPERPRADAPEAPQPVPRRHPDDDPDGRGHARVRALRRLEPGGAGQAGHVDPADGHVRHPDRPGARLVLDHLLLRDQGEGRDALVQDDRRADPRRPRLPLRGLPAERQQDGPGGGQPAVHQGPAVGDGRVLRHRRRSWRWSTARPIPRSTRPSAATSTRTPSTTA